MSGVDDRIVSMKFDNAEFERKMSGTLSSLDKLQSSLNSTGKTHGFQDITAAANSVNLSHLTGVIDGIGTKFNAMGAVAFAALDRITNKALAAGQKFVGAFTFEPIKAGFQEFETNMNSIQTILANTSSKGTTLDDVNVALDQLNQYSDKTIYNFSQMARNIGTFTAAGIDLDTSVSAIKGIANLAAVSGSNAEQASTAMYQLSQALAAGSVKLMDWNSVVNAGMGGEVFQKALFETGKKMKTIAGVPMGMSFEQWKESGESFRLTLEQGWLTADVLTETLNTFTGDLSLAQVISMGYTRAQAEEIVKMGKMANAAATEVKTLTQLLGTVKEAVGSGWSASFRLIIGDFNESKALFTAINNGIGKMVGASADARNNLLNQWKFMGGRNALLEGMAHAVEALSKVMMPIKDAFRDFFPKMTASRLLDITEAFTRFMDKLVPSYDTMVKIHKIFSGIFAALDIGVEIVKGIVGVIGDLIGNLGGVSGGASDAAVSFADWIVSIHKVLVDGKAIQAFFERVSNAIQHPIKFLERFVHHLSLIDGVPGAGKVESAFDRISSRLSGIAGFAHSVGEAWQKMGDRLSGVLGVLDKVWNAIADWFKNLGKHIAGVLRPGDFDSAVDIVNVGLLGGIAIMFKKFTQDGFAGIFGKDLVKSITGAFGQLTNTLKSMQAKVKAETLFKIAESVGILTISMVALSMIDSAALTKALTAMAVGFGELVATMKAMDKFGGSGAKTAALASSMILMASAMAILSIAVKNLSTLSTSELAKGLTGVGVSMNVMVQSMNLMTADKSGMIRAGIAMIAIAVALNVLALAVKSFAEMSYSEMLKGLVGVAGGLTVVTIAMNSMPPSSVLGGLGFIAVAVGLNILALALKSFAEMSWSEMGKGLLGIAAGLFIVVGAMNGMPVTAPITAAGVLILSAALVVMAEAVKIMGNIKFGDMVKGIGGLAAMLAILVLATNSMNGALPGAAAMVVVSGALLILTHVLLELSKLSLEELLIGLAGMAGVFLVIGAAAVILNPIIPLILALGVALGVVGLAFVFFGVGAMLVSKAWEVMAKAGKVGVQVFLDCLKMIIDAVPELVSSIANALVQFATEIINAMDLLLRVAVVFISDLLDSIVTLAPKIAKTIVTVINEGLKALQKLFPQFVKTGITLFMSLLKGLRDNIGEITTLAAEIVTGFLDALSEKVPEIVDSAYNLIFTVLTEVAEKIGSGAPRLYVAIGRALIDGLLSGLRDAFPNLYRWFRDLPGNILNIVKSLFGIKSPSSKFAEIGGNIITGLYNGLVNTISKVTTWFTELPGKIIGWVGNVLGTLKNKGIDLISGLLSGIGQKALDVAAWYIGLPGKILGWIGNLISTLKTKGINLIGGLLQGIVEKAIDVADWFRGLPERIKNSIGGLLTTLKQLGKDLMQGLWDGIKDTWHSITGWFTDSSIHLPTKGITDSVKKMAEKVKVLDNMQPTITPVVDMSNVDAARRHIDDAFYRPNKPDTRDVVGRKNPAKNQLPAWVQTYADIWSGKTPMNRDTIAWADASQRNAQAAAANHRTESIHESVHRTPNSILFTQINNSPRALNAAEIYRNTRSQIARQREKWFDATAHNAGY